MTKTYSYADAPGGAGGANVRWNGIALVGRQLLILLSSVILARILGPQAYGVVAQANIFIALTTLLLDQGLTASLISQRSVTGRMAGAAASVNIILALVLAVATWFLAIPLAHFFNTPELELVLKVLGGGLIFKALAIVPLMLLQRQRRFKSIAAAEILSALTGGILGLIAALIGWSYWSIVVQLVSTDFVAAIVFLVVTRPPLPNVSFRALGGSFAFGIRVFFGNLLSFVSRNIDNLLVGRVFGATQLGYYSLAYRVLLTPIQMIGQTVTRVLFPAIASAQGDLPEISRLLIKSTRGIALASFPLMALVAISAPDTIVVFLGPAWNPAVPVLAILAVTGARQAVTSTNAPLLLGSGRADIHLRFNIVAAIIQVGGIVAGLPFGIVGVAWGYTIAGIVLSPLIGYLQKLLAGTRYRVQLGVLLGPTVCALSGAASYALLYLAPMPPVLRFGAGIVIFIVVFGGVLRLFFRKTWRSARTDLTTLAPRR